MFQNHLLSTILLVLVPHVFAQEKGTSSDGKASEPAVVVPVFANPSCPIMGKPVSTKLFVDTEKGRIYLCCKGCNKDVLADVAAAHQTAYPVVKKVENKTCPITGEEIEANDPRVTVQGFEFAVANEQAAAKARDDSQATLVKLQQPKVVDLDNKTCPLTGEAAAKNTICVIGDTIVRLSSPKCVDQVVDAPSAVLEKAKSIARAEANEKPEKR